MNTGFPKPTNKYFKAGDFQDQSMTLTFKGWEKKGNEDMTTKDGNKITWKNRLKYMLRYSYPKLAVDETGDPIIDSNTGEQMQNRNFDDKFPKGYTIEYHFEEGVLTCGSLPLFNTFGMVQPKKGEKVTISRTGEGLETKWKVSKDASADFSAPAFSGDPAVNDSDIPF